MKALLILVSAVIAPTLNLSAEQFGDFTYTINADMNTLTISDYTGAGGAVVIPAVIDRKSVTRIGDYAFSGSSRLTSVTISGGVTHIGVNAFNGCRRMTSIIIPDGVTHIGSDAFFGCSGLTNATLPDGVTHIGNYAFAYCYSLTSITLPASVTSIGAQTFSSCTSLPAIAVNSANLNYSSSDGVLFDKSQATLLTYPAGRVDSRYTLPASVILVEDEAFAGSALTSVTIPDRITRIGRQMFSGCSLLTSITLPEGVTHIGDFAFSDCIRLTSVTIPESVIHIGRYAFDSCTGLTGVYFRGDAPSKGNGILDNSPTVVYYLSGATGWGTTFARQPTVRWNPSIQTGDGNWGIQAGAFGFTIIESQRGLVVVESSTNLTDGLWVPLKTNSMSGGTISFSDPDVTNNPGRYYRLATP